MKLEHVALRRHHTSAVTIVPHLERQRNCFDCSSCLFAFRCGAIIALFASCFPRRFASLSVALFVILSKGSESVGEKVPRGSSETVGSMLLVIRCGRGGRLKVGRSVGGAS